MNFPTGTTSQSLDVQVVDDSGLPVSGLVAATFPATSWSLAGNTAATTISLSDLAAITTAYTSGGVKERSGGYYRLDLPNAALANAGIVTLIGEASGKRLVHPRIQVGATVTAASVTGNVGGNVAGSVASVTGAVGSVAGNVGGNVVGNLLGTLTTTERTAIANAVETEIIDETDSEKVLAAITDKIASVNPSLSGLTLAAIAAAVRDVSNASPAGSSLGAAVNAIPTAAANGAATLAATADGIAVSTILARLNALARGLVSVTNNGNGTYTLVFKLQDGTTTAFTLIYNPTTGART
jgi:hypothetical protein